MGHQLVTLREVAGLDRRRRRRRDALRQSFHGDSADSVWPVAAGPEFRVLSAGELRSPIHVIAPTARPLSFRHADMEFDLDSVEFRPRTLGRSLLFAAALIGAPIRSGK